jgi:hypothetical protein
MSMYVCLWFGDGVARRCANRCVHTCAQLVAGTRTNIRARSRAPARAEVENGTAVTLHCCFNDTLFRFKKKLPCKKKFCNLTLGHCINDTQAQVPRVRATVFELRVYISLPPPLPLPLPHTQRTAMAAALGIAQPQRRQLSARASTSAAPLRLHMLCQKKCSAALCALQNFSKLSDLWHFLYEVNS